MRETGYYWVKFGKLASWEVAWFESLNGVFWLIGRGDYTCAGWEFYKIHETRIKTPDEK